MLAAPDGETLLVFHLDVGEFVTERRVVRERRQVGQLFKIVPPRRADRLVQKIRKIGVCLHQPAPRRDAVGDADELVVVVDEIAEQVVAQDLRVKLGDAVDAVAHRNGEVCHADLIEGDDCHVADALHLPREAARQVAAVTLVDRVGDLPDARQKLAVKLCGPLFERLDHDRVVRVAEHVVRDPIRLVESHALFVHQDAHEFGNRERRVRVVDVNDDLVGKQRQRAAGIALFIVLDDVLHRRGREEIVLLQAKRLALQMVVGRVEHFGDDLRQLLFLRGAHVVAACERVHVERLGRFGAPKAKGKRGVGVIPQNGNVVGHGGDVRGILIAHAKTALGPVLDHAAAEDDVHRVVRHGYLPDVAVVQPAVGKLHLLPVDDKLFEQAVFIADAAAHRGQIERRQRVHKAGGKTAEAAVPQSRLRLHVLQFRDRHAELAERGGERLILTQIDQIAAQRAPDQKFDGKVVNAFFMLLDARRTRGGPFADDLVTRHERHRFIEVVFRGLFDRAAKMQAQFFGYGVQDLLLAFFKFDGTVVARLRCHKRNPP